MKERAEHVLGAQVARDGDVAGVGHDGKRAALLTPTLRMPICTPGMHRADQTSTCVALDQAVGVLRRVLGLGLIVELDDLDLTPAELAALLGEQQLDGEA